MVTKHHCHYPECSEVVPPKLWGCKTHWMSLPKYLREKIWKHYRSGQEITKTPSREYLEVALEVQEYISLKNIELKQNTMFSLTKLINKLSEKRDRIRKEITAHMASNNVKVMDSKKGSLTLVEPEITVWNIEELVKLASSKEVLDRAKKEGIAESTQEMLDFMFDRSLNKLHVEELIQHKVLRTKQISKFMSTKPTAKYVRTNVKD